MNGEANNNAGAHKRIRVLIADDSAAFRNAVGLFLERLPQDLVLMDLQMPRLDGLQATRKIRAKFPNVHVIMISLHDSQELRAASAASGADRFILKHCLRDELPGALAQLFPGRAGGAEEE